VTDATRARGSLPARAAFDLRALARRKAELGITTSVVIPAREEAGRVGAVVAAVRRAMEVVDSTGVALVDELVVVDGGSRDGTAAEAERAGARVVQQPTGQHGEGTGEGTGEGAGGNAAARGKGAALQLGVASTSGDLVAFVDADVREPDEWLAVGTLAPLLMDEQLRLVKSAAQRSWDGGAGAGGGRVTELTVRPLLALLWPEVAHVAQPLAGEYAADRALLESVPFERGYGVELGLLLDTLRMCGADAIGQVDLGVRGHEHQPLDALARMAAELVLVVADRLAVEGRALDGVDVGSLVVPRFTRGEHATLQVTGETARRDPLPPLAPLAPPVSGGPLPPRRGPSRSS
jgi:glucosyl-3-phosphoglycerate synthase